MLLFIFSCKGKDDYILKGRILFREKPLYDAEVQVFLKKEKEKETPPIKVVATDEKGEFSLKLPKGKYYLVAKKKYEEDGETDMLYGNYQDEPLELASDTVLKDWNLESKKDKNFEKGTGIKGEVMGFKNYRNVRVYVYKDSSTGLKGPDYLNKSRVDKNGSFTIDLPPDRYFLVVRERRSGNSGLLKDGDLTGEYKNNPVLIKEKGYLDIGAITVKPVDKNKVKEINEKGVIERGSAQLSGIIVDKNGNPVKNVYVLLYDKPEMVGRPTLISTPSDRGGKFSVAIRKPGKYYIGARSKIGGPAEPGELIGTYVGSSDKGVIIDNGSNLKIKIEVVEVW